MHACDCKHPYYECIESVVWRTLMLVLYNFFTLIFLSVNKIVSVKRVWHVRKCPYAIFDDTILCKRALSIYLETIWVLINHLLSPQCYYFSIKLSHFVNGQKKLTLLFEASKKYNFNSWNRMLEQGTIVFCNAKKNDQY